MNSVTLIGYTQPVKEDGDPEDIISYCARVSNPQNQSNFETAGKLLQYCVRKQHWSIFEMGQVIMEIKCTRDIARQILRHRSFSFQEFSQRYAEVDTDSLVYGEARLQDTKNRQNSLELNQTDPLHTEWHDRQKLVAIAAQAAYDWAIENDIAKECARVVLPEGMTPSVMYMAGSPRSWMHYCWLRMGNGTQKEHQLIAQKAWVILCDIYPFMQEI